MQKSPIVIKIGTYFKTEFKTEETSATVVAQPVFLAFKLEARGLLQVWHQPGLHSVFQKKRKTEDSPTFINVNFMDFFKKHKVFMYIDYRTKNKTVKQKDQ